jgi:dihydrofolate synthase/folylpolyglutamate synthase
MIHTYQDAIKYLYEHLPIFQHVGASAYKPSLANTIRLCNVLGNPQKKIKSVHVAGTNGKGSTSHMLASILQSSGYKTGLYTSPHLKDFSERIKINGQNVSEGFVIDFVNRIADAIQEIQPSFFEITAVMAFEYFAAEKIDIAVIETGLGGRLDATNVIDPEISVITNIGWDHKEILGNSLTDIASEKAGIIKANVPVVISERQQEVESVFVAKAIEMNAPIQFASDQYRVQQVNKPGKFYYDAFRNEQLFMTQIRLPLEGIYQTQNLAGVLSIVDGLSSKGFNITEQFIRDGLESVVTQTNLKGRWQKLSEAPLMICDTGHNVDGITQVVRQIRQQSVNHIHFVLGVVKDKDINEVLAILPKEASYYFCQAKIPRAMDATLLAEKANAVGLQGEVVPDVNDAIRRALIFANENDLVFIGGSTFVVAEIQGL